MPSSHFRNFCRESKCLDRSCQFSISSSLSCYSWLYNLTPLGKSTRPSPPVSWPKKNRRQRMRSSSFKSLLAVTTTRIRLAASSYHSIGKSKIRCPCCSNSSNSSVAKTSRYPKPTAPTPVSTLNPHCVSEKPTRYCSQALSQAGLLIDGPGLGEAGEAVRRRVELLECVTVVGEVHPRA